MSTAAVEGRLAATNEGIFPRSAEGRLRWALLGNATFSTLTGLTAIAFATPIAQWIGRSRQELMSLGIELVAFAAVVAFLATRKSITGGWVFSAIMTVAALDVLWVLGSVAVIAQPAVLSSAGKLVTGVVALVVADFAAMQLWFGFKARFQSR